MANKNLGNDQYIKALVYVFIALGAFIIAIVSAYFGAVGLYFGQGVVEGDVWQNYKFTCANADESASTCTNFTTTETDAYADYVTFRTDLNAVVPRYIQATTIIFSLLGLVFLFLALKTSGLWSGKKEGKRDEM